MERKDTLLFAFKDTFYSVFQKDCQQNEHAVFYFLISFINSFRQGQKGKKISIAPQIHTRFRSPLHAPRTS